MKVCDHCLQKASVGLESVKIGTKSFDLCKDCANRIIVWVESPDKPSVFNKIDKFLGNSK